MFCIRADFVPAIYIGDLDESIKRKLLKFADGTNLVCNVDGERILN